MSTKKQIIVLCILCGFWGGCDTSPKERIAAAKSVINQANSVSQSVSTSIDNLNQVVAATELLLSDPNITVESKAQLQTALTVAKAKLNALIEQKQKVDNVILQTKAILDAIDANNVDSQTELSAYGNVVTASAPSLPASISGYAYLAGLLIPILGGLVTKLVIQIQKIKQQTAEINQQKTILADAVVSVDVLLDPKLNEGVIPEDKVKAAKAVLEYNQLGVTSDAVDAIHNPQKSTGPS